MFFLGNRERAKVLVNATRNMSFLFGAENLSPTIIAWLLTKRCNLSCRHCNSYLNRDKINTENLLKIANKIANSNTEIIVLSGGEPLLVPNIKEIINILKNSGKIVKINTNALLLEKFNDFIIEKKIDCVSVSLDSEDPITHNKIRGEETSYQKALQNLKYLKENRKNGLPQLEIRGVIMKSNYKDLAKYYEQLEGIVDSITFQPIHNNDSHHAVVDKNELFDKNNKVEQETLENTLKELSKLNKKFNSYYYNKFSDFLFHPEEMEMIALNACLPTWFNFMPISETGKGLSCNHEIGDLNEESATIESVWCSKKRLEFLKNISRFGKCRNPCWLNCTSVAPEISGKILKNIVNLVSKEKEVDESFKKNTIYTGSSI